MTKLTDDQKHLVIHRANVLRSAREAGPWGGDWDFGVAYGMGVVMDAAYGIVTSGRIQRLSGRVSRMDRFNPPADEPYPYDCDDPENYDDLGRSCVEDADTDDLIWNEDGYDNAGTEG